MNEEQPHICEVLDLFEAPKKERFCSFCKKKESQVKKLITNSLPKENMRNICNECIVLAKSRLESSRTE